MNRSRLNQIGLYRIGLLFLFLPLSSIGQAQDMPAGASDCGSYDVDVSREMELIAQGHEKIVAGASPDGAVPVLEPNHAYQLQLAEQTAVTFKAAPGRLMLDDGSFAGIATFSVPSDGTWRVGIDTQSWVDVLDPANVRVESGRFGGRTACAGLRKMVEFPLKAGDQYTLQLSGGTQAAIAVMITGPIATTP